MYDFPDQLLALPDPALSLRREILMSALFKYVAEVREIEDGHAFKFPRGAMIARRIANYILFEGVHSPQMSFVVIADPNGKELWLEVRETECISPSGEGHSYL